MHRHCGSNSSTNATMSTKRVSSLLLLVLLIWNEGAEVLCQDVNVADVMTDSVELSWKRSGRWLGVSEFTVQFSTPESSICEKVIACKSVSCKFISLDVCGTVDACSKTFTTISGGNYTATEVVLVTGPKAVSNFNVSVDQGVLHINWKNPSKDSSPCYKDTAVEVTFNEENTTTHHAFDEEYQNVELCRKIGSGIVVVRTTGGDGKSGYDLSTYSQSTSDLVALVTMESCKPLGCTSLQASWSYFPVCSAVTSFNVSVDYDSYHTGDIDATNTTTFTGIQPKVFYNVCIRALSAKGADLDDSCQTCYSLPAVIYNLTAATQPEDNSHLGVAWDLPLCQVTDITYDIEYTSFLSKMTFTTSHNYMTFTGMYDYQYDVCVKAQGNPADPTCTTAYTTIRKLGYVYTSGFNGDLPITVAWHYYESDYPNVTITYQVTWGSEQQYKGRTQNMSYTIQKYENPNYSQHICVAAIPDNKDDLISEAYCTYVYGHYGGNDAPIGLIIGLSVAAVIVVVFIVSLALYSYKRRRHANTNVTMNQRL